MLRDYLRGVFLVSFMYNNIPNKKFRVAKFEHLFRVGRVTGNRGTFL